MWSILNRRKKKASAFILRSSMNWEGHTLFAYTRRKKTSQHTMEKVNDYLFVEFHFSWHFFFFPCCCCCYKITLTKPSETRHHEWDKVKTKSVVSWTTTTTTNQKKFLITEFLAFKVDKNFHAPFAFMHV